MDHITLISNLTIRENLSLPLIFVGMDLVRRNEIIEQALCDYQLTTTTQKFFRYLTEEEQGQVLQLRNVLSESYPSYDRFRTLLDANNNADLGLRLLQHELFTNIARDLMEASVQIAAERFSLAVAALDSAIERTALRVALGVYYVNPSLRVMDIALLVIRNYRNILKYHEKVDVDILETAKKRAVPNLKALADSFLEMRTQR
ncbi:MAG: hypothetical protein JSV76_00700 [Candidatus Bathyarchaeota archaeon]|nr:MAG: hypothetical protein JSV76_00700 [Candidatus Bathyarchaeota archaeon]